MCVSERERKEIGRVRKRVKVFPHTQQIRSETEKDTEKENRNKYIGNIFKIDYFQSRDVGLRSFQTNVCKYVFPNRLTNDGLYLHYHLSLTKDDLKSPPIRIPCMACL